MEHTTRAKKTNTPKGNLASTTQAVNTKTALTAVIDRLLAACPQLKTSKTGQCTVENTRAAATRDMHRLLTVTPTKQCKQATAAERRHQKLAVNDTRTRSGRRTSEAHLGGDTGNRRGPGFPLAKLDRLAVPKREPRKIKKTKTPGDAKRHQATPRGADSSCTTQCGTPSRCVFGLGGRARAKI